jgi:hypothetical protein
MLNSGAGPAFIELKLTISLNVRRDRSALQGILLAGSAGSLDVHAPALNLFAATVKSLKTRFRTLVRAETYYTLSTTLHSMGSDASGQKKKKF